MLEVRIEELKQLIDQLVSEHSSTKQAITELNQKLELTMQSIEKTPAEKEPVKNNQKPKQKKKRRRYGGVLTLDDLR